MAARAVAAEKAVAAELDRRGRARGRRDTRRETLGKAAMGPEESAAEKAVARAYTPWECTSLAVRSMERIEACTFVRLAYKQTTKGGMPIRGEQRMS